MENEIYMSNKEPIFNVSLPKEEQTMHLAQILRWYHSNDKMTKAKSRDFYLEWVKQYRSTEEYIEIQQVAPQLLITSWGWVARIVANSPQAPNCHEFLHKITTNLLGNERAKTKIIEKSINNDRVNDLINDIDKELEAIRQKLLETKNIETELDIYSLLKSSNLNAFEVKHFCGVLEKKQLGISELKNNYNEDKAKELGFTSKARVTIYSSVMYKLVLQAKKYYNEIKKTMKAV